MAKKWTSRSWPLPLPLPLPLPWARPKQWPKLLAVDKSFNMAPALISVARNWNNWSLGRHRLARQDICHSPRYSVHSPIYLCLTAGALIFDEFAKDCLSGVNRGRQSCFRPGNRVKDAAATATKALLKSIFINLTSAFWLLVCWMRDVGHSVAAAAEHYSYDV